MKSIEAVAQRDSGEVVETPELIDPEQPSCSESATLRAAHEGWKKSATRPANTLREFKYAVDRFTELHGDLPVAQIKRPHVLRFREALQEMPLWRSGKLRTATLPELVAWSKEPPHSTAQKVSAQTVNKLLGSVQAVCVWARNNGVIPEDMLWSDPFSKMRLPTRRSRREPWRLEELRTLFSSAIFTQGDRPVTGKGEAAFWLPLMALFTGARLNELAPLTAADVITDAATDIVSINIKEDQEQGRRLKTVGSARLVPIHPELTRIGFLRFVDWISSAGQEARLFPLLTPGRKGWLRRDVVEMVRTSQAGAGDHKQGKCVPLVSPRLQGCRAGCPRQRGPARRTHGSCGLFSRTDLRGKGYGEAVRSGDAG